MKKTIIFLLIATIFLNSCSIADNGDDLTGFVLRLNHKNETYNLTENGFLYSEESHSYSKFFTINENELLLNFEADNKSRLTKMNIVTQNEFYADTDTLNFISDLIKTFINNNDTFEKVIDETNFFDVIKTKTTDTVKTENGNINLLIDVTEIGCVITIYKEI